eukprot:CAMPEP_0197394400 /NCGR_PEP_ID=MMETSP1165-20131217/5147_1 /TAXON_ID=284809 /ORGANISM="Chrysocystis fragilis, Strain CCMP3189" /LENGTH=46 /DNA_ID= /DNA_START= /DNA_END= /DNA_ORIENTATION=
MTQRVARSCVIPERDEAGNMLVRCVRSTWPYLLGSVASPIREGRTP